MRRFLRGALRPRLAACAVLTVVVLAAPAQARPGTMHLMGGGTATFSQVVALAWPAGSSATAPNNQAASYEFFMEEPNVAMASNGDTIAITGEGEFAVHPKSASGEGEFTAMSAGGQTVAGTWTVNGLV